MHSVECIPPTCREYGIHKIWRDVDLLFWPWCDCNRASWGSAVWCKTRDHIGIITITGVCSTSLLGHLLHRFPVTDDITQVKYPIKFMAYKNVHIWEQHFQRRYASTEVKWIWMTGINYSNLEMHWVGMTQVITSQQWKPMKLPI